MSAPNANPPRSLDALGSTDGHPEKRDLSAPSSASASSSPAKEGQDGSKDVARVPMTTARFAASMTAILLAESVNAIDSNAIGVASPVIAEAIGASYDNIAWLQSTYLLATVALMLTWGRMYATFDSKWVIIVALLFFLIGSALCGAATSLGMFLAGRTLAGVGGSGSFVGIWSIIAIISPPSKRPTWISLSNATWAVWMKAAPLVGAGLVQNVTWRWIFYLALPVGGFALIVLLLALPALPPVAVPDDDSMPGKSRGLLGTLAALDFPGTVLSCGGAIALVYPLLVGGQPNSPWTSGRVLGPLLASPFIYALFAASQFRPTLKKSHRTVPVHVFARDRTVGLLVIITLMGGVVGITPSYFLPIFYEIVEGRSVVRSAVMILPFIVFGTVSIGISGGVAEKTGIWSPLLIIGAIICAIGGGLLSTTSATTADGAFFAWQIILGLGSGSLANLAPIVMQHLVDPDEIAQASSLVALAMNFGALIGIAVGGALLNDQIGKFVTDEVPRLANMLGSSGQGSSLADCLRSASGPEALLRCTRQQGLPGNIIQNFSQTLQGYLQQGFYRIWISFVAAAGIAFFASLMVRHFRLPVAEKGVKASSESKPEVTLSA
ncbi:MFS general substrate transporter [Ceraceosorus guamensis]|uniref:MFS general substrate transporter n=1 Tax=Ceraceosorus guamensis TaxID=1522189 RepID=A0A316VNV8_9BASI|nr:MFS general substrate transporter [Ceraceosorus guamensis]PWN39257.1 MFS general substrate transporter [Ceraceosorus guamensis]